MGRITGRSDDMIILRGVNLFPSQIEELALKIPALSPHFTLEITRPNRMDQMTIHIERREDATREEAEEGARRLLHDQDEDRLQRHDRHRRAGHPGPFLREAAARVRPPRQVSSGVAGARCCGGAQVTSR